MYLKTILASEVKKVDPVFLVSNLDKFPIFNPFFLT